MIDLGSFSGGIAGFKNRVQITSSQNWVVPDKVRLIKVLTTGAGGAGGGSLTGDGPTPGQGGAAGGVGVAMIDVIPGQILNITIGAGGVGVNGANGNNGGNTIARIGNVIVCAGLGGPGGIKNSSLTQSSSGLAHCLNSEFYFGGAGGGGGSVGVGVIATGGSYAAAPRGNSQTFTTIAGQTANNGGTGGSVTGGGGGGGCSFYGRGGTGGNGVNSNIVGNNGLAPTSTAYGAGGGGAGGSNGSGGATGGNSANGAAEIYY